VPYTFTPVPPSEANSAYGAVFFTGDSASPTDWTAVLEIASITKKNFSIPAIDVTHLTSPNATEEMFPGIIKPGTIELTGNFIGDATQLGFLTFAEGQTVFPFKMTAPMQKGSKTYTAVGTCFVTESEDGPYEANKKIDFKVTLQVTGVTAITVA